MKAKTPMDNLTQSQGKAQSALDQRSVTKSVASVSQMQTPNKAEE
jgi:hypothetical protein